MAFKASLAARPRVPEATCGDEESCSSFTPEQLKAVSKLRYFFFLLLDDAGHRLCMVLHLCPHPEEPLD